MTGVKILKPTDRVIINLEKQDIEYLKSLNINRSRFMRIAIKHHREGRFRYEP